MFNSVSDQRFKAEDGYVARITIPRNEYATIYEGDVNAQNAYDFMRNYLNHISDDGIVKAITVHDTDRSDLFEIEASISYDDHHAEYFPHYTFSEPLM